MVKLTSTNMSSASVWAKSTLADTRQEKRTAQEVKRGITRSDCVNLSAAKQRFYGQEKDTRRYAGVPK
jgi:hypothetical protein